MMTTSVGQSTRICGAIYETLRQVQLNAAQNNKDLVAAGKTWWMKREIAEAQKYAAPKKKSLK